MNAADTAPALNQLKRCSAAVQQWFLQNDLQLNAGKSEVILLGTATQLRSVAVFLQLTVTATEIEK